jgi:hypothetical protein
MTIPVLIERIGNNGYRAKTGEPLPLAAEGGSREEALGKLQDALRCRMEKGAELTLVVESDREKPWLRFAGVFKDDPDFEDVQRIIAESRRQMDADPNIP